MYASAAGTARESWSGSTFGNLPIGQGFSMTVLQLAGMYQAIANDGLRVPPRIVAATVGCRATVTTNAAAVPSPPTTAKTGMSRPRQRTLPGGR